LIWSSSKVRSFIELAYTVEGVKGGTTLKGLSDTTGRVEGFFLGVGAGVRTGVIEVIETVGFNCDEGFETGTTLNGLSNITLGYVEGFFSEARVEAGVGTGTATRVFGTVGIAGILGIVEVIMRAVEIGGASGRGLEALFSCARHSKGSM
jgi:hypothetical protein